MKYDQLNFVVAVSAKAESMTSRMDEVLRIKMALAKHLMDNDYKFAIVSEDVVSNEQRLGAVCNLIISVIPKSAGTIAQIDEGHALKTDMSDVIWNVGNRCIIADEDMMSDVAKQKIQYLPKEGGQWYEQ